MTATHSKLEKLSFSGKDEDFAAFSEQFEARMYMLNLGKCLEDKLTVPVYKEDETRGEETARVKSEDERKKQRFMVWCEFVQCLDKASINFILLHKPDGFKAEDEEKKQRFMVWCELVQCLDKASINFIRLHKPDGVEAWKAIVGKHRSTERPRIQTLLTQLAGLKMAPGEKVTHYLTRAEGIRLPFKKQAR